MLFDKRWSRILCTTNVITISSILCKDKNIARNAKRMLSRKTFIMREVWFFFFLLKFFLIFLFFFPLFSQKKKKFWFWKSCFYSWTQNPSSIPKYIYSKKHFLRSTYGLVFKRGFEKDQKSNFNSDFLIYKKIIILIKKKKNWKKETVTIFIIHRNILFF